MLIVGKLAVLSVAGQKLVELNPGVSIGEMGVFSGHMRSATVVAVGDCAGLVIARESIHQLMDGDHSIKATIMANVVEELSDRLAEANGKVDALMSAVQAHEATAAAAREELLATSEIASEEVSEEDTLADDDVAEGSEDPVEEEETSE